MSVCVSLHGFVSLERARARRVDSLRFAVEKTRDTHHFLLSPSLCHTTYRSKYTPLKRDLDLHVLYSEDLLVAHVGLDCWQAPGKQPSKPAQ